MVASALARLTSSVIPITEVREQENKQPVEGGDSIYLPLNLMAIGSAVKDKIFKFLGKKDAEETMLILPVKKGKRSVKIHAHVPHKRLVQLRKEALKKKLKPDIVKMLSQAIKVSENESRKEAIWKKLIAKTDVWEDIFKNKTQKLFDEQENIVAGKVEVSKKAIKARDELAQFLFDLVNEDQKWNNELNPLLKNILKEQGRDTLNFLGFNEDLDLTQKEVVKYLREFAGEIIHGINKTTLQKLRITLAEGVREEEGIDTLKRRVESVFDEARGSRAEAIARTEVLRASNFATVQAYEQSGVVRAKEWLTALDERVCPICIPLDGKVVDKNKAFKTSVGDIDYPPAHPSCRCTTIPVIV